MGQYLTRRSLHSLVSLLGLIVLVFFLARLTGDPTNLYLPLDASLEARAEFAEKHGFTDPLLVQFGRFLGDLAQFDFGESISKARPALEVVLEAFPTTLKLAGLTMVMARGAGRRGRLARGVPAGRRVRSHRERDLARRRQRPRLLDRDHRHPAVRGDARLAADLGHRHALRTGSCRSACC